MSEPTFNKQEEPATPDQEPVDQGAQGPSEGDKPFLEVEGRQFFSPDDVKKKLTSADSFIDQLKQERQQDREKMERMSSQLEDMAAKLEKAKGVDELLDKLDRGDSGVDKTNTSVDLDSVKRELRDEIFSDLTRKEQEQVQERNFTEVANALQERYGDKADSVVFEKASELGYSREEVADFAKNKPRAFLALFAPAEKRESTDKPTIGRGIRTEGVESDAGPTSFQKYSSARTDKERIEAYRERLNAALESA